MSAKSTELAENGDAVDIDIGLTEEKENDLDMDEVDSILKDGSRISYRDIDLSELELKLKNDTTTLGKCGYLLFQCWKGILIFEIHIMFIICLFVFTIAQLSFLGDSNNPAQSIFVGLIASILMYTLLMLLYGLVYCLGYSTNGITKRKYLSPGNPLRVFYFLVVATAFYACVYVLVQIHSQCFDNNGNYIENSVTNGNTTTIYYCNVQKIILN